MSLITLYRPATNDYNLYYEDNPSLSIICEDQYSGMLELSKIRGNRGRSNQHHELQSEQESECRKRIKYDIF